jgi:hypothetical protein
MLDSTLQKNRIFQNPFFFFLPFLLFYIVFIFIFQHPTPWGDETRNLRDVYNLLQGYFSPPPPNIILGSGPGYQLVVLPFIALKFPLLAIRLLNALFLYFSIVLLFKILVKFVPRTLAICCSFFWGCYYNSYDFLAVIYSETITLLIVTLLLFLLLKVFSPLQKTFSKKYIVLSGLVFGYLILVKVIFAYVLLCMLLGVGVLWLLNRQASNYRKSFYILLIAFATLLPYLCYTYQLTGKVFYLSTQSGNNLYWMSSLAEDEYGSWFYSPLHGTKVGESSSNKVPPTKISSIDFKSRSQYFPGYEDTIAVRHANDFAVLSPYENTGVALDEMYKELAIKNIQANPIKFIKNCWSNVGRILFNYPYSYSLQKPATLLRFPLNGLLLLLMLVAAIPTYKNWKHIPFAIRFMLCVMALYLGGSILGCAEIRMFTVAVPVLLVWLAFVLQKSVHINLAKWK